MIVERREVRPPRPPAAQRRRRRCASVASFATAAARGSPATMLPLARRLARGLGAGRASSRPLKLVVHVDGGARGNPGPGRRRRASSPTPDGEVLAEHAEPLGDATNNVAEYRALLLGLAHARELGASEVEVVGDSELVAKQVQGVYKVKHAAMRPLHARGAGGAARRSSAGRSARCRARRTRTPTRSSTRPLDGATA